MKKTNKNKLRKIIVTLMPLLAFLFSAWILIIGINAYLNNASYFKIKKAVLNGLDDQKVGQQISRDFLNDNIFNLDIRKIREEIKIANPQFYDVEVIRNFPDQITINVMLRKPIAQVKQKGYFLIDSEGVIVSEISNKPFDSYIIISGLNGVSSFSFGKRINLNRLRAGLRLSSLLKSSMTMLISLIHQLVNDKMEIDISKHPSLFAFFGNLELRFYYDNLEKQLQLLFNILPSLEKRIKDVQYIDFRFAEPVVYFKNKK